MSLTEPWQLLSFSDFETIIALVTALAAGIVRGFSGFGSAMILAPIYASVFGPVTAVPAVLALEALISLPLLKSSVNSAQYDTVFRMFVAAIAGATLGMGIAATLPINAVKAIVAYIVLVFAVLMAFQKPGSELSLPVTKPLKYVAGGASGLFGSISGMTGPPAVLLMLNSNASPLSIRATLIIYFMLIDFSLVIGYGLMEKQFHLEWLGLVVVSLIPMTVGSWLGGYLLQFASERLFRNLTLSMVALAAIISLCI